MAGDSQQDGSDVGRDGPGWKRCHWFTGDLLVSAWQARARVHGTIGRRAMTLSGAGQFRPWSRYRTRANRETLESGHIAPELRCQPCVSAGCLPRVRRVPSGRVLVVPPRRTYPSQGGPGWRVRRRLLPGTRFRPVSGARHVRTPLWGAYASLSRAPGLGRQPAPCRAAKAVAHLPWTLRRHSLVKAPATPGKEVMSKE
jgi:hypothetical protein